MTTIKRMINTTIDEEVGNDQYELAFTEGDIVEVLDCHLADEFHSDEFHSGVVVLVKNDVKEMWIDAGFLTRI